MDTHSLPDVYRAICDNNLHALCERAITTEGVSDHVVEKLSRFAEPAKDNKEIKSIISSAITGLGFVGNKSIADNMRRSTFDFRDMKRTPMTVYVILPARYVMSCSGWMRTITNAWADACLREEEE